MGRATGRARFSPHFSNHTAPAPAPLRARPRDTGNTLGCGECASELGKSAEWFRENLEALYGRGMPRPIDQPGHRRWDMAEWLAWRRGFKGPKDAANDHAAQAQPFTDDEHRERLRRAYAR